MFIVIKDEPLDDFFAKPFGFVSLTKIQELLTP